MEYKHCPNCKKKLEGFMTSKYIVKDTTTKLINTFHEHKSEAYCNECAQMLIIEFKTANDSKITALNKSISQNIYVIPIVTVQSPFNWHYEMLEMISAQSISGTGFLTELTSSWSDMTGGQSLSMASKVSSGEEICKNKLRYQCALLGGNAIIATDIDYSEVGGTKGMLMVCMAGTAVNVDFGAVVSDRTEKLDLIQKQVRELNPLTEIKYPSSDYYL